MRTIVTPDDWISLQLGYYMCNHKLGTEFLGEKVAVNEFRMDYLEPDGTVHCVKFDAIKMSQHFSGCTFLPNLRRTAESRDLQYLAKGYGIIWIESRDHGIVIATVTPGNMLMFPIWDFDYRDKGKGRLIHVVSRDQFAWDKVISEIGVNKWQYVQAAGRLYKGTNGYPVSCKEIATCRQKDVLFDNAHMELAFDLFIAQNKINELAEKLAK